MTAHLWGYNGQVAGATIECVEGDKVHLRHQQSCPSIPPCTGTACCAERHGRRRRLDQPHIKPGKTFVYEFAMKKSGTFMYHPHADEMVRWRWDDGDFRRAPARSQAASGRSRLRVSSERFQTSTPAVTCRR